MAFKLFHFRLLEQSPEDGGGGAPARRPTPAEINHQRNQDRLARINAIANSSDGRRAREMSDTEGERIVGRFQGGELDNSEEAIERQAQIDDDLARQALEEQRERAEESERLEEEEARRLQAEGGEEAESPRLAARRGPQTETESDEADEKVIDGVRYYRTIVSGSEKWLTLKELREGVSRGLTTEETLQRAQEALRSAAQAPATPKEPPAEVDDKDLANIILAAGMGDEEAVQKLVSVIKTPRGARPEEVDRLVTERIATRRLQDQGEEACADLLGDENLAPVFRLRFAQLQKTHPTMHILEAYKTVGNKMRKDFAAMIKPREGQDPRSKAERKREIVTPPRSAGRQPARRDDDREVPVSEEIDAIARSRGQARAHRIRRS